MLPDGLEVRTYEPDDDASCKDLEVSASQFQGLGGLIKAAVQHLSSFDAKPRQFSDHVLLVVSNTETRAVCAVVAVALKSAFVHGKTRRCGYVFDLRVSESHQRRGIGSALTREAEKVCQERGVEFLYLSVNNDNAKAKMLYAANGWVHGSNRALIMRPLLATPAAPKDDAAYARSVGGVRELTTGEALKVTGDYYAARELGPSANEFRAVFQSNQLLGTFAASDNADGSMAALSLWHGSTLTSFRPVTLLLPVALWVRLAPFLAAGAVTAAAGLVTLIFRAAPGPVTQSALALACAAAAGAVATCWRWASSRIAFRARAFAPVMVGPRGEQLMRAVHAHVARVARERGFAVLVINEAIGSPLASCLRGDRPRQSSPRSPTVFWQKSLSSALPGDLPPLQADMFFDPRDM